MLFSCLERIHKKGGDRPNLTSNLIQNQPKFSNSGGGEIKKIKLTEHYDFF